MTQDILVQILAGNGASIAVLVYIILKLRAVEEELRELRRDVGGLAAELKRAGERVARLEGAYNAYMRTASRG